MGKDTVTELYDLARISKLTDNVEINLPVKKHRALRAIQFQPGADKRYMISVNIGQLPPADAQRYMSDVRKTLKGWLPAGSFLIVPVRNGHPEVGLYELTKVGTGTDVDL